jgi:hypothetical protein
LENKSNRLIRICLPARAGTDGNDIVGQVKPEEILRRITINYFKSIFPVVNNNDAFAL